MFEPQEQIAPVSWQKPFRKLEYAFPPFAKSARICRLRTGMERAGYGTDAPFHEFTVEPCSGAIESRRSPIGLFGCARPGAALCAPPPRAPRRPIAVNPP